MPFKSREARLKYHRQYFKEHRQEAKAYAALHKDAINLGRRTRHSNGRKGLADLRIRHGKSDTLAYQLLCGAKKRAKTKGLPFNLEIADVPTVPAVCPVLGIRILANVGRVGDSSPSLDRVCPARGYTVGNVRIISWKANRLRSNATASELALVLADSERLEAR